MTTHGLGAVSELVPAPPCTSVGQRPLARVNFKTQMACTGSDHEILNITQVDFNEVRLS